MSVHFGVVEEMKIIDEFTQCLANSGHKYSFSKSVVLQAITRFKTMKIRSTLDKDDPRFLPLYRNRWYDFDRRCMIKMTLGRSWYSGKNFGDTYKQEWKHRLKRKGENNRHRERAIETRHMERAVETRPPRPSTVMFVPSSDGGLLLRMLEGLESELWLNKDVTWSVKLIEKSGKQLKTLFSTRIPIM